MGSIIKRNIFRTLLVLVFLCSLSFIQGQNKTTAPSHVAISTIAPRPEDVGNLNGMMKAFYEVISGPAGQARQWSRDRSLYIPGVQFVATTSQNGKVFARVLDHQTYVDWVNDDFVKEGFFENEIYRVTRTFGNITHVFSTYESRRKVDGPVTERGVNSLELYYDGKRWWIASVTWDNERPDNPIPRELLPEELP